ncbi:MAG: hypothetical protein KKA05_04615 [Alphaproteobacteria bacterium]|nr:hypothetical protein [Alphaproteobacteria bacterium]
MSHIPNLRTAGRESLTVRFSRAADLPDILSYYGANRHDAVDIRKADVTENAVKTGRFLLVRDKTGALRAGSATYDFATASGADKRGWSEMGTTRATLPGFSLYQFMVSSQVIREFLENTPTDRFFAIIDHDNDAVIKRLYQTGWKDYVADQHLVDALESTKDWHTDNAVVWRCATTDTLPHQARTVLAQIQKGKLVNPRTGAEADLDFSQFPLANELLPHLQALAYGPFADMLEKSPHLGLKSARALLDNHLKNSVQSPQPKP